MPIFVPGAEKMQRDLACAQERWQHSLRKVEEKQAEFDLWDDPRSRWFVEHVLRKEFDRVAHGRCTVYPALPLQNAIAQGQYNEVKAMLGRRDKLEAELTAFRQQEADDRAAVQKLTAKIKRKEGQDDA